jgi:hypothetical protein
MENIHAFPIVSPSIGPPGGGCEVSDSFPPGLFVPRFMCFSPSPSCRTAVLENACASLLTKERENEALRARLGMAGGGGGGDVLDLMRQAATARDNDNHRFARMDSRNSEVVPSFLSRAHVFHLLSRACCKTVPLPTNVGIQ